MKKRYLSLFALCGLTLTMTMKPIAVFSDTLDTEQVSSTNQKDTSIANAENNIIDIATGWTILSAETDYPNLDMNDVLVQGRDKETTNERMMVMQFANIGNANMTIQKVIPMKKGYTYDLNLIYAMFMQPSNPNSTDPLQATAYMDFDGEKVSDKPSPSDNLYQKRVKPTEDRNYVITVHFEVARQENGYIKLAQPLDKGGVVVTPNATIEAHDSTINQGSTWNQFDNLDSIVSNDGQNIDHKNVQVIHNVNTSIPGLYPVTYSYDNVSKTINVTVKAKQKGADVTTKYVNEINGKQIAEDEIQSGYIGDTYLTHQKKISGYSFKEVKGKSTGTFSDKPQTITYIYTKNPVKAAGVIAKYIDTDGNNISEDIIEMGNIGEKYATKQKDIEGYTFKEVKGQPKGVFTDKPQTVTYIYDRKKVSKVLPYNPTNNNDNNSKDKYVTQNSFGALPRTGEKSGILFSMIGLMMMIFMSILLFLKKITNRKKGN